MTDSPYKMPAVGSFYQWRPGSIWDHEVVEVIGTDAGNELVELSGPSGVRWVSLDDFEQSAQAPPLRKP